MNITTNVDEEFFKMYIDGLLHFCYQREQFVALNSYIEDDGILKPSYHIVFKFKTTDLRLEYDKKDKWKEVLRNLISK